MFDYIVVVVGEESEVEQLERFQWHEGVIQDSVLIPVAESSWKGRAGNGLGTLFAILNASSAVGKELVAEVKHGKSVLIVHSAGEGTRNILTRTCKSKAFIELPGGLTILEGVIKQFQPFSIPYRILVTWGDQFFFIADAPELIRECAQLSHVMLFGLKLKSELTEEMVSRYGIQIVRWGEGSTGGGKACELLDFDDTRDYEAVQRKIERHRAGDGGTEAGVLLNLGLFTLSGALAERMLDIFRDRLEEREGKFNSDELWQLWVSPRDSYPGSPAARWLIERAERLKMEMDSGSGSSLILSFAMSESSIWLDFGTNESYYNNMMSLLRGEGEPLREFLNLPHATDVRGDEHDRGCEIQDSICVNAEIDEGLIKRSVVSNTRMKYAVLEDACVFNSRVERMRGRNCVVYHLVDANGELLEVNDCVLVDVFHPVRGRIRLRFPIGKENGPKDEWWSSTLPGNEYSLREVAAMVAGTSVDEMEATRERHIRLADAIASDVESVRAVVRRPLKLKPIRINKPWGYELWCASPRNCVEIEGEGDGEGDGEEFISWRWCLCELNSFFSELIFGLRMEEFPLMVKIIKAEENLSVQVHPDDLYARSLGDVMGKEEAWYVIEARAGAKVYLGWSGSSYTSDGNGRFRFRELVKGGEIMNYLHTSDAHVGDIYHIPPGVIHALGAGITVYEASTTSERTFRVYDYGRGRELHLDDALNVLKFDEPRGWELKHEGEHLRGRHLDLRLITVHDGAGATIVNMEGASLLTCVRGQVTLIRGDAKLPLNTFETVLVPAACEREGEGVRVRGGGRVEHKLELEGNGELIAASFIIP